MEITMHKRVGENTLSIELKAIDSTDDQQMDLIAKIAALVESFEKTGKQATP